jgi:3-deoxy-7-phosphoheptulonate synthase
MVVVMKPDATAEQIDAVVERVERAGGSAFVSRGVVRTIIGLVGDVEHFRGLNLRSLDGVADVRRISDPFKLVSRQHRPERSTVYVGAAKVPIGPGTFTFAAGPCAVESERQAVEAARMSKAAGASLLRGGAFKPRLSPYDFPGLGLEGLRVLAKVGASVGLPVVTEVVEAADVDVVCEHADMVQVGAGSMSNLALLEAVGARSRPVLLERGVQATVEEWLMAAEYVARQGNLDIVLCERGIRTFESATRHTLDISAVPLVQAASHLPVVVDPAHAGGDRDLVVPLARAAIAVGADGVLVDVHPTPEDALCDGPVSLSGNELRALASAVRQLPPLVGRETVRPH